MENQDVDLKKVEEIANTARNSLSTYCFTECKAKCCRKGFLLLTSKEVPLMKNNVEDLDVVPVDETEKRYVMNLGSRPEGCPNLKDYKCLIHKNPNRPKACKEFPLFVWKNKTIAVSMKCPAAKEQKLYPYLAELKNLGYNIIYLEDTR